MSRALEEEWTKTVLAAAADIPGQDTFVRVVLDTQPQAVVNLRPKPDAGGWIVLTLHQPVTLTAATQAAYRQALVTLTGLRRHGEVELTACLCPNDGETLIARCVATQLVPQKMCDILSELHDILQQAFAMATDASDPEYSSVVASTKSGAGTHANLMQQGWVLG